MDQDHNSDVDDKVDQQGTAADDIDQKHGGSSSKSDQSIELQKTGTILVRNCFLVLSFT